MWVKQTEDTRLPQWLQSSLSHTCKYCGSEMLDYYNDAGRCTNRKCSNDECPGFLAAKADTMRTILGLKGVGFATCLNTITAYKLKSHLDLLPLWNVRPTVTVDIFLRIHCIPGVDTEWEKIVKTNDIYTLDELYSSYNGKNRSLLDKYKDELYAHANYVNFVQRPANSSRKKDALVITIMITGTPNGYSTKEDFVNTLNAALGGYIIIVHQKTKRQTGVDALIREPGSTTRGKVEAAIKGGIPIMTSKQFIDFLVETMRKMQEENRDDNS